MRSVLAAMDNVVAFRRTGPQGPLQGQGFARSQGFAQSQDGPAAGSLAVRRSDQRALMDMVYAAGSLAVAAGDRDTKLVAARLQVYGFVVIEEMGADGQLRRLRPSEAIRARAERPWRLSKAAYGGSLAVTIPTSDGFLFDHTAGMPA